MGKPGNAFFGQSKIKSRAFSGLGFHPYLSAVALYDFFANGQADARTFHCVDLLEDGENALMILRVDARAIVADGQKPIALTGLGGDMDLRGRVAAVLDGI